MGLNAKEERAGACGGGGENLSGCGLSMLGRENSARVVERARGVWIENPKEGSYELQVGMCVCEGRSLLYGGVHAWGMSWSAIKCAVG